MTRSSQDLAAMEETAWGAGGKGAAGAEQLLKGPEPPLQERVSTESGLITTGNSLYHKYPN